MDMKRVLLASLAPAIWGSTFLVTTELLPSDVPLHNAVLRALPAGLLLWVLSRQLPSLAWLPRLMVLGALNFSIFWWLLFVAAYRLPGGVAATIGAIQPLIVFALSSVLIGTRLNWKVYVAGATGLLGVGLLVLNARATLDLIGVIAAIGGAVSMGLGVVLTKRWQPPVPPLVFASWQLIAGGLLVWPFAIAFEPAMPSLTWVNVLGYAYLSLIGGALTYVVWFSGIRNLGPAAVTTLGFLSPVSAAALGWLVLSQDLTVLQALGALLILASVYASIKVQSALQKSAPPQARTPSATDTRRSRTASDPGFTATAPHLSRVAIPRRPTGGSYRHPGSPPAPDPMAARRTTDLS